MLRRVVVLGVLVAVTTAFLPACSGGAYVQNAPPAAPTVDKPPRPPGQNIVWVPGHHEYIGGKYVWKQGHWQKARPGKVWVSGHWKHTRRGHKWVPGHWK